jgi:hypothetical protein
VLLTRAAAESALPSLLGMALDYTPALDGHDARRKVGIITEAEIKAAQALTANAALIEVAGHLFARDFPEIVETIRGERVAAVAASSSGLQKSATPDSPLAPIPASTFNRLQAAIDGRRLGMSYEITDVSVADRSAPIWVLTEVVFTGAAVLRRDKAAYQNTWIALAA